MSDSALLPQELLTTGFLKSTPVIGRIMSLRGTKFSGSASPSQDSGTQSSQQSSRSKGTKGKARRSKGDASDKVIEIHLCGGTTPASVILLKVWDKDVQMRIGPVAQNGAAVRVTHCKVEDHTERTAPFTTSRLRVYLRAMPLTQMTAIDNRPEWPLYHPLTSVEDLRTLPAKKTGLCGGSRSGATAIDR